MRLSRSHLIILLTFLLLPLLACGAIPEREGLLTQWWQGNGAGEDTTAVSSRNDISRDYITFQTISYRQVLNAGETVPGTKLVYIGPRDRLYEVEIDGQRATKSAGDSFRWQGILHAGVFGDFDLRLSPQLLGDMLAVGTVNLTVLNPMPIEAELPQDVTNWHQFPELIVDMTVPVGERIPGTVLTYDGLESQGARLGNTAGYPYLAQADSMRWTGRLSTNAYIQYNLRVISISDQTLRLAGVAELWVRK